MSLRANLPDVMMATCDGSIELETIGIDAAYKQDHATCVHAHSGHFHCVKSRSSRGHDGYDIKLPEEFVVKVSHSSRVKVLMRP